MSDTEEVKNYPSEEEYYFSEGEEDEEIVPENEYDMDDYFATLSDNITSYCEKNSIPICQYLNPNLLIDFYEN